VLRAHRADPRTARTPFVFLTGRAERADVRAGMTLGADDYLTKPFTRADLLDAVHARLARYGVRDSRPSPEKRTDGSGQTRPDESVSA
jgi:DNA-binding response OmpR family regulator